MNKYNFLTSEDTPEFKHISFDLWLTLIRSHPEFKAKRAALFQSFFNIGGDTEEIFTVLRYYDNTCNKINETTGRNLDSFEIYLLVLARFGIHPSVDQLQEFYTETEKLLFQYPPVLLDHFDEAFFAGVKERGITLNILSNTGFIKGKTLRSLLDNYFIGRYMDFQLYSDEEGISKPNKQFFQKIFSYLHKPIPGKDIIHVGDNEKADYRGALEAGLSAYLITN